VHQLLKGDEIALLPALDQFGVWLAKTTKARLSFLAKNE
jgi:hypothetical protein